MDQISSAYLVVLVWLRLGPIFGQVCVLPGTCSTGGTSPVGPGQIEPRILTPTITMTPPISCPPGLVSCSGSVVVQCGVRYVSPISTDDGNARSGAHPWSAFIVNQTSYTGSGALLDQYHVLTAAHKVASNVATPFNIRVLMGLWNPSLTFGVQNRTAVRLIVHPRYNPINLFNDIAIIRVDSPFLLGVSPTVNTACLPAQTTSFVGQNCIVAGWGQSQYGSPNTSPSRSQKQVTLPVVSYATCRTSFSQPSVLGSNVDTYLDPNGEVCAGGQQDRDACTDDGGAPLMCADQNTGRYTIAGLVIWGKGCGQAGMYGVYVSVPPYRSWIDATISQLNANSPQG